MNKILVFLKMLIVFGLLQFFISTATAQEKTDNTVLTNSNIIELVKAGLSESIILAKIKNSKSEFDTSSSALIKLKENGVSDNLVTAMIEVKPKSNNSIKSETVSKNPLDIKDAVGKRKVFVESDDARSQLTLNAKLKEKGFEVVSKSEDAEIILRLETETKFASQIGGPFGSGASQNKVGKLAAYLQQDSERHLIFAKDQIVISLHGITGVAPLYKQAEDMFKSFIKAMKRAGDTIK